MYTQRQIITRRTTTAVQKREWHQDRSPITGNNHSKRIEEVGMSQSVSQWVSQEDIYGRHNLSIIMHLDKSHTTINMFFFKTYTCFIWSEIAIRKGSLSLRNVDCSTLQTSHANQPTTYTYTNTHTNNCQSIHACMHSFNSTSPLHHSFTRTNEPRITIAIHHNHPSIHQPCIARYHSVWHSYMHASRCHGSHTMECICHHLSERHTYIHACMHRDENDKNDDDDDEILALFLQPTESADEHLWWWW